MLGVSNESDLKFFENLITQNVLNYCNTSHGQVFWDQNNEIISAIHENDGEFRSEYMTKMFEHFGIEVEYHSEIPDFVKKMPGYEDYGENEDLYF